jgi:hypothetical protein
MMENLLSKALFAMIPSKNPDSKICMLESHKCLDKIGMDQLKRWK